MSMEGKKKVWCCHQACNTYSFENKGILKWECYKHYPGKFSCVQIDTNPELTTGEKLDMLLAHLGLELSLTPAKAEIRKVKK